MVADYDDASLGDYEKQFSFFSETISPNDIGGDWLAPGTTTYDMASATGTIITVQHNCSYDFLGASVTNPVEIVTDQGATMDVTSATYFSGPNVTTINYTNIDGTAPALGQRLRVNAIPRYNKKATAPDNAFAVQPYKYK
jgi:hypothetical protein